MVLLAIAFILQVLGQHPLGKCRPRLATHPASSPGYSAAKLRPEPRLSHVRLLAHLFPLKTLVDLRRASHAKHEIPIREHPIDAIQGPGRDAAVPRHQLRQPTGRSPHANGQIGVGLRGGGPKCSF
jgi:hypothetical protein